MIQEIVWKSEKEIARNIEYVLRIINFFFLLHSNSSHLMSFSLTLQNLLQVSYSIELLKFHRYYDIIQMHYQENNVDFNR